MEDKISKWLGMHGVGIPLLLGRGKLKAHLC